MKVTPLFVAMQPAELASLGSPSDYYLSLYQSQTETDAQIARHYGSARNAVRAGREFFSAVVALLHADRCKSAGNAEMMRVVTNLYKALGAAAKFLNAPFTIQSRVSGITVVDRDPVVLSESDKTDEAAETDKASESSANALANAAATAEDQKTIIAEQAAIIAELRADNARLIAANADLVLQLDAARKPQATARKRSSAARTA